MSTRILIRVAGLALGIATLVLVLGTMNSPVQGPSPYASALSDLSVANASAALDAGARILDGSLGGLGGCPFAPGATGNVVFEDLVFLCESKGFDTGIDIEKLIAVRSILRSEMPNEALYGGLARAGLPGRKSSVAA